MSDDPYSRVDYRRLIAWPERVRREAPFLRELAAAAPLPRALDLGCGTGEHARFLASEGLEVVGVDRSPSMLDKAREGELPAGLRFIAGDLTELASLVDGRFGLALCLGNVLPHLRDEQALDTFFSGLRQHLAPGGVFCLQILNYERIIGQKVRYLPVSVRPGEGEEIVFLRLMTPRDDGTVLFNPTTLAYRPGAEPPVEVVASKNVELRGWRRPELAARLAAAGFAAVEPFGGMQREPYQSDTSADLVLVAR